MKKNLLSILLLTLLISMTACKGNEEIIKETPFLEVVTTELNFEEVEGSQEITVKSNSQWNVSVEENGASWCKVTPNNGNATVTVTENPEKNIRSTNLTISCGNLSKTIKVSQLGWGKAILLSPSSVNVEALGGDFSVEVTTNVEYSITIPDNVSWLSVAPESRNSHPVVTKVSTFKVSSNTLDNQRNTSISFKDNDEGSDLEPVELTVIQMGVGQYEPVDIEGIKDDIKINITGGKASSFQPGSGIEKSFDGDLSTLYHSSWDNSGANYFPITLEYYFAEGTDMDYFIYYPRQSGPNGLFKEVDIEVKTNANSRGVEEWKTVMTYNFNGSSTATKVDFPSPLIGVSAIKMTVKSGAGDNQGFASCAEMEFYRKNPDSFDYSTLFTDMTCSELKPGVTEEQINSCEYSFYKNIAFYLYLGKYKSEFRVNKFKAYPHPDVQSKENKTSSYSLMDNPTGISVSEGETLIILADDLKGQKLSLRIQNLDAPEADGANNPVTYPIMSGVNKIKTSKKGLAYVMYHTPEYETAPEIKLHFATGDVNGYFDIQNEAHNGRASELLSAATDKYFDVLGKYAHLTFPTERFRNHTTDLVKLIEAYDKIVYHEQEFLGLKKYDRMFKNRMYFNVMYTSYMYATSYRTAYNDNTMSELCNENKLVTSAIWGPAHEVGHCNQTRPGLKWLGTTEVTNNIMSEYIQTNIFGQPSRVQTENMNNPKAPNRYSKAWNNILVGKIAHAAEGDVFCKLIPFWQLQLYFGNAKGQTPELTEDKGGFYPEVYEHIRTNPNLATPGLQQLEFVYIASLKSNTNLIDFFEKWGFLKPVDIKMDDYGSGTMRITEEDVNNLKTRVAALNLPACNEAIEYITDNTVDVFKNKLAVVKGTATRTGNTLTMRNWKNVVVYEVRNNDANGDLICVSDGVLTPSTTASFDVATDWKDTYKVYAVSFDNTRTEVTFSE